MQDDGSKRTTPEQTMSPNRTISWPWIMHDDFKPSDELGRDTQNHDEERERSVRPEQSSQLEKSETNEDTAS